MRDPLRVLHQVYEPVRRRVATSLPGGYSLGPRYVQIQLGYACNLRCWFCGQWGRTGHFKQLSANQLQETLPLDLLKRLVDELPSVCTRILLWGGEPLLYPNLVPLVRYAAERHKHCEIITNGTLLAKHAVGLLQAGLENVYVSLDGTEELHDRYRARGSYRATFEGIRAVRAERGRLGKELPRITVIFTTLPENVGELPALAREVREAGADAILVTRLNYATKEMGQAHERALQTLFQIQAPSWKGFWRDEPLGDPENVKALVEALKNPSEFNGFVIIGDPRSRWAPNDWYRYYSDPTYVLPSNPRCLFPWYAAGICPNGDVVPCPDFPDYVAGNLHQQSFSEIWNGKKMRQFRRSLRKHGRFPVCSCCCHLYED